MTISTPHINRSCHPSLSLFISLIRILFLHCKSNYCALSCDMAIIWFHHLTGVCVRFAKRAFDPQISSASLPSLALSTFLHRPLYRCSQGIKMKSCVESGSYIHEICVTHHCSKDAIYLCMNMFVLKKMCLSILIQDQVCRHCVCLYILSLLFSLGSFSLTL